MQWSAIHLATATMIKLKGIDLAVIAALLHYLLSILEMRLEAVAIETQVVQYFPLMW